MMHFWVQSLVKLAASVVFLSLVQAGAHLSGVKVDFFTGVVCGAAIMCAFGIADAWMKP